MTDESQTCEVCGAVAGASSVRSAMFIETMRQRGHQAPEERHVSRSSARWPAVAHRIVPFLWSLAELGERACYKHGALNGASTHAAGSRIIEAPVSKHAD